MRTKLTIITLLLAFTASACILSDSGPHTTTETIPGGQTQLRGECFAKITTPGDQYQCTIYPGDGDTSVKDVRYVQFDQGVHYWPLVSSVVSLPGQEDTWVHVREVNTYVSTDSTQNNQRRTECHPAADFTAKGLTPSDYIEAGQTYACGLHMIQDNGYIAWTKISGTGAIIDAGVFCQSPPTCSGQQSPWANYITQPVVRVLQ